MRSSRMVLLVAGLALIHCAAYLASYAPTPLGRVPLLDAREVLDLASAIAAGSLPAEPFYRAPLYPALVAALAPAHAGLETLSWIARLINVAAQLSTCLAAAVAAMRWHGRPVAGAIAGGLLALYPVAVYFSGDAGDTNLGMALFALGLCAAIADHRREDGGRLRWIARPATTLLALSLATLARPQYAVTVVAVAALLALDVARRHTTRGAALRALAVGAAVLLTLPLANWKISGDPMLLPWQGAYNAYAANGPDGNGRWFTQTIAVGSQPAHRNPTRVESELRYQQETGSQAPPAPRENQRYWYGRLAEHVRAHPLAVAGRLLAKTYYLIFNAEQYNNKTYALQKAASPVLSHNPLGFALLLALALAGAWLRRAVPEDARSGPLPDGAARAGRQPPGWLLVSAAYAAGVVLFLVSDRFRLPLVIPLAILAGGLLHWRAFDLAQLRARWLTAVAALLLVAASSIPVVQEPDLTAVEDAVLEASAAIEVGDDAVALTAATRAIGLAPRNRHALSAYCVATYNHLLRAPSAAAATVAANACDGALPESDQARYLRAVIHWQQGHPDLAIAGWTALAQQGGAAATDALAALVWCGALPGSRFADDPDRQGIPDLVLLALATRGQTWAGTALQERRPAAWQAAQLQALQHAIPLAPSAHGPAPMR